MPDQNLRPPMADDDPGYFTRLSIALCPQDDGTRPVNPAWPGADLGFLSPAISYSSFPLVVGQAVDVIVHINNFGTIDASGAYLELAYNLYLGLQPQGLVPITNRPLPVIPAGGSHTAQISWTPPDTSAIHACVHARVFDIYSLSNYAKRCFEWSPYMNPQAGCRNTILIKIVDETKPLIITLPVRNAFENPIRVRMLVSTIDTRSRFNDPESRYPLPFTPERSTEADLAALTATGPRGVLVADLGRIRPAPITTAANPLFERTWAKILPLAENGLWPRADVAPDLLHEEYGFDIDGAVSVPERIQREKRGYAFGDSVGSARLKSLHTLTLQRAEEGQVRIVIPPDQFPERGRRRKFQIDFQVGTDRPTQQFIYLAH